jgi:hypothetical protein
LDRYAYVRNNPIRYNDPTGHNEDCGIGEECLIGHGNPNDEPSEVPEEYRSEYLRAVARKFSIMLPPGYKFVYIDGGTSTHPYAEGWQPWFSTYNGTNPDYGTVTLADGTVLDPSVNGTAMEYDVYISSNAFDKSSSPDDIGMYEIHEGDHAWLEANVRDSGLIVDPGGDGDPSSFDWGMDRINRIERHAYDAALAAVDSRLNPSDTIEQFFEDMQDRTDGWWWFEPTIDSSLWGYP